MPSCLPVQHLIVVDPAVTGYEVLLNSVSSDAQIAILDSAQDSIAQITRLLQGLPQDEGYLTLHLVAHGDPGRLYLGRTQLDVASLDRYGSQLTAWFKDPSRTTVAVYGCRVAAGSWGERFVNTLHHLTGAALAASRTLVGRAALGGSWNLDYQLAQPRLAVPFAAAALHAFPGVLTNAPTIADASTALRTTAEDTSLSLAGLSISDIDGEPQSVTLSVANGTLTLGTVAGLVGLTGQGTGALSFSGAIADINAALASLVFTPTANYNGAGALTINVNDGDQSASRTVNFNVTAVNDEPTLAPTAVTVNEAGTVTFGAANLGLVDTDNQPVQLIIKLSSLPSRGYLTHGGAPVVVGSTFSSDKIGQLVYHHDGTQALGASGTSDSFQITVEDGAGGLVAATTLPIAIAPINQAPAVTGTNTVFEGQQNYPVTITFSDPDQTQPFNVEVLSLPVDGVLKVNGVAVSVGQVLTPANLATLTYSHDGNDDNGGFPPNDSFQVRAVDDGGGTATPATVTATINLNIIADNDDPVLVKNTGASLDGVRQVQLTSAMLQVTDPDSSNQQLTYTLTALPTEGVVLYNNGGTLQRMVVGSSFTQSDLNSGKISYYFLNPASSAGVTDRFKFTVRDGELRVWPSLREGGIYADSGQNTPLTELTFNLTAKNLTGTFGGGSGAGGGFPPKGTSLPPSVDVNTGANVINTGGQLNEGATITIDAAKLKVIDSDTPPEQIVFRLMGLPTGGKLFLNGNQLSNYQSFTQKDINDGLLTFVHSGNEVFIDNFRFTLSDGSNVVSNGGAPFTFNIDVTPQNDAPTAVVKAAPFGVEGGTIILGSSHIGLSDVDGSGDKSGVGFATPNSLTFKVLDLPDYGVLQVDQGSGFVTVTAATVITKAQLDGGKLRYVHDGNENFADSFQIQVNDNSGAANNLSAPQTVAISIAKLNDDPALFSSLNLKVAEGEKGTIKGALYAPGEAHLIYADPDNTTIQRQYRITQKVANGKLLRGGVVLGVGSVFTQKDLDDGLIEYQHDDSENFTDLFKFEVRDGGGGVVPGSYTITIDPTVNDAPTLTMPTAPQTFNTVAPFVFSTAKGNAITLADPDLLSVDVGEVDILRVTLDLRDAGVTTLEGTLSLAATAGLTFLSGTADGQAKITFEGKKQAVDAALEGLRVNVTNDLDKTLSLVVTVDDRNNGGRDPNPLPPGYSTIVTKTIQINTSNNNDAPTVIAPLTAAVNEDTGLAFNGALAGLITIGDVDDFGSAMTVTVAIDSGKGTLAMPGASGNGSATLTLTGTKAQINTALASLVYTPTADYNGPATLTVTASDNGNTGPGPAKTATQTVTITVNPINDSPTLQVPAATQVVDSGTPLTFAAGAIALDDAKDLPQGAADVFSVTIAANRTFDNSLFGTLSATASGAAIVSPSGSTLTITGTRADVNATLNSLSYTPAVSNIDDVIRLTVTVNDGNNGAEGTGSVGGSPTVSKTINVNVSSSNEAPALTSPSNPLSVNEDSSITLTGAGNLFSFTDADDFGANNLTAKITATKGTLSLVSADGTTVSGSGTGVLTLTGTKTQLNAALDGLVFTPTANYHGPASLTVEINDQGNTGSGGPQIDSKTVAITVNPVNDRPVASGAASVAAIAEDTSAPAGTLLSTLLAPQYSDVTDNQTSNGGGNAATPLSYVAIVGSSNYIAGQGTWQVSDGAGGWINVPTSGLSAGAALLFPTSREIRFVPAANFHGTPGTLSVRLADGSTTITNFSTSSSTLRSLSSNGGTTTTGAWSNNSVTVGTTVSTANDAPVITSAATPTVLASINEDVTNPSGATVAALFAVKYSDAVDNQNAITGGGNNATNFAGIAITSNAANSTTEGIWQYNTGSGWVDVPTSGLSDAAALVLPTTASLRFAPVANYNGKPGDLTVRFSDGNSLTMGTAVNLGTVGGTSRWSGSTTVLTTNVIAINDAPVINGSGATPTYIENGGGAAVGNNLISLSDVEIGRAELTDQVTATVKITNFFSGDQLAFATGGTGITATNQGSGTYSLSGGTLANMYAVLQSAAYSSTSDNPTDYNNSKPSRTITFEINDGQAVSNLSNTITSTVTVQPVNDAPVVVTSNGSTTFTEGNNVTSTPVIVDGALTVGDPDNLTLASGSVSITGGFESGRDILAFTNNSSALYGNISATYNSATGQLSFTSAGATATLAQWQNAFRAITYTSTSETPSNTNRTVEFRVNDGALNSLIATKTLVVTPVNDTPIAVNDVNSVVEDAIAPALGNVLANDTDLDNPGALSATQFQKGATVVADPNQDIAGTYGSLNWNSDGTYAYTLNNANPAVQGLDEGQTLTDTFTYTMSDGQGGTSTATLTVTINGKNDQPIATFLNNQSSLDKDSVSLNIAGRFSDPDTTDVLTYNATGLPPGLTLNPTTGLISGTIDRSASQGGLDSNGIYAVSVIATDNNGEQASFSFAWVVANPAPTATANTGSVTEDGPLTSAGNLITTNTGSGIDSDPDGDPLTVTAIQKGAATFNNPAQPAVGSYGSLAWNLNGTYTYILDNANSAVQKLTDGEKLFDTFTYTLSDGQGGTSTATLTITVNGRNDAPVSTALTNQASLDKGPVNLDISGNFSDPDTTGTLTYSATGLPTGLTLNPTTGVISGTIDRSASQGGPSSNGLYTVAVTATDNSGTFTTQTFTWTVTNPTPTATVNTGTVSEDGTLTSVGNLITDNNGSGIDSDPDGDPLTVTAIQKGATAFTNSAQPITGSYGTLVWGSAGTYTYTLDNTNSKVQALDDSETLTDTFTYTISDGQGGTSTATLTVTINGKNDAPTSTTISNQAGVDKGSVNLDLSGSFSDPDATDTRTFSATGLPTGLAIDPTTGIISGTIDRSASQGGTGGVYSVEITATDNNGATTTQTFTWTITNPGPTATDNAADMGEDGTLTHIGNLITSNEGSGVDGDPDGDPLTVTAIQKGPTTVTDPNQPVAGTYGTLTWNSGGTYTYTLNNADPAVQALDENETRTDSFTYTVSDGQGGTNSATLTITINGKNDAPTSTLLGAQNSVDSGAVSLNLSGQFNDLDATDLLTFSATGLPPGLNIDPVTGIISGTIDRSASQGGPGSNGVYTVSITATDDSGEQTSQSFTWTVTNPGPTATKNAGSVSEDGTFTRSGNLITADEGFSPDSDPDGDPLTVTGMQHGATAVTDSTQPIAGSYGSLAWSSDGTYTYTLNNTNSDVQKLDEGQALFDTFTYTISDGQGGTSAATLTITINGQNDAPTSTTISDRTGVDQGVVNLDLSSSFNDVDSTDTLAFSATGLPLGLSIDPATGIISGTIDRSASQGGPGSNGVHTVTVTATDNSGIATNQSFTWTVTNPAPTATPNAGAVSEDGTLIRSGNLIPDNDGSGIDSDPDGDPLSISAIQKGATTVTNPNQPVVGSYGSLSWNPNGTYIYTLDNTNSKVQALDDSETLTDIFTYTISDGQGGTSTATLTITVNGKNDAPASTALSNQTGVDQGVVSLDVSGKFSDPDATDTRTFSATGLPTGLTIDPTTGIISGTIDRSASQGGISGVYTVEVTATDNNGATTVQPFTWTVTNPAPTATNNTGTVSEDGTLTRSGNLITNNDGIGVDSDPDGDPLSVVSIQAGATLVTNPAQAVGGSYGSLSWNPNGTYTYTLNNANPAVQALTDTQTLTDSFTYTVSDGQGGTSAATLTITINGKNDNPISSGLPNQSGVDQGAVSLDVSSSFSNPNIGSSLTFSATGLPIGLTLDQTTGVISGTIDRSASQSGPGSNGTYTVAVTATDTSGAATTESFTWTVTNPGPTAVNNAGAVTEDGALTRSGSLITDNDGSGVDSDPDGDSLSITSMSNGVATVTDPNQAVTGTYGSLVWNANGTYTYTLNNGNSAVQKLDESETLSDSFTYTVSDGQGGTSTATLLITINGQNDVPTSTLLSNQNGVDQGSVSLDVSGSFSDLDATDKLTFSATGLPTGLSLDPATGMISGTIDRSASQGGTGGVYTVAVTATDDSGATNTRSFTWTVTNPGPTATNNAGSLEEDGTLTRSGNLITDNDGSGVDSDPDGDPLSVVAIQKNATTVTDPAQAIVGSYGSLSWSPNGTYTYTLNNTSPAVQALNDGQTLLDTFTYTVSDGQGGTQTASLAITVNGKNDAPVLDLNGSGAGSDYITRYSPVAGPATLASTAAQISDVDNTHLQKMTLTLVERPNGAGDRLVLTAALPAGITASAYDPATGQIILSGNASLSAYQAALAVIGYNNTATVQDRRDRTLQIVINDGKADSNLATTLIRWEVSNGGNGTPGDDIVTGVDPNGGISGLSDPDAFYGYGGNDIINGGSDVDVIDGGDGNDILNGGSGVDLMLGGAGNDVLSSGSGNDFVDGGTGDDVLMGSGGDDWLIGGDGNDTLNGGRDNDVLIGGAGADTLTGGQGADVFKYQSLGDGGDTITDFAIVSDRIDLSALFSGTGSFATSVQLQQIGSNTLVLAKLAGSTQPLVLLQNVAATNLGAQHFVFTPTYTAPVPSSTSSNTSHALPGGKAGDYLASNPDLMAAFGYNLDAASQHYSQFGWQENRSVDTFAEDIYLASNSDLIKAFGYNLNAATQHYIQHGHQEGRQTNLFNPQQYLNAYSDLKAAFGSDTVAATRHYIEYGYREGRDPLLGFDGAAYIASYSDLITAFGYNPQAGKQHYMQHGASEGRSVSFEADDYLASHGDLIEAFGHNLAAATQHYITFGVGEKRIPDMFDEVAYLNKYSDLQAAFGTDTQAATQHYIQYGYWEKRTAI